jgi:hypothetical protein
VVDRNVRCKQAKGKTNFDPLPPDVALTLPGFDAPSIFLSDRTEAPPAVLEAPVDRPILFCNKIKEAHDYLEGKGASPGPIQDGGGTQFFEICDPEGNCIEICKEP